MVINSKERLTFSQKQLPCRRRKHEDENKLTDMRSLSLIENFSSGRPRSCNRRACVRSLLTKSDDREAGADLLFTSMFTDRIGRPDVLLPINHNHYNFRKTESFNW